MARADKGMKLSARGLSLSGLQVVNFENTHGRDEIFVLVDSTSVESYIYDPLSNNGFSPTTSYTDFEIEVNTTGYLLGTEKIVEIAGGVSTLKVRYDNGLCLIGVRSYNGNFVISMLKDIARITKHNEYPVASPISYYKTGAGTSPLMALLEGDILAVFEGKDADYTVTIDDAIATSSDGGRVGMVGSLTVFSQNGLLKINTPTTGAVSIDGYGTIVRKTDATKDIKLGTQVATVANEIVDYSARFSPLHYAYIELNRFETKSYWVGVGNTGYVVDMGNSVFMNVPITDNSTVGTSSLTPTPAIDDTIDFVVVGGVIKKVVGTALSDIGTITDTAEMLIDRIYHTDMSTVIAVDTNGIQKEVEPFSVSGYFFGYGDGHLADVDVATL